MVELSFYTSFCRFSVLSLTGIRINTLAINSLCQLAKSSSLTVLKLGGTYIGDVSIYVRFSMERNVTAVQYSVVMQDGVIKLNETVSTGLQELVRLDLSYCGLKSHDFPRVCQNLILLGGILELNISGNSIGQEVSLCNYTTQWLFIIFFLAF